MKIYKLKISRYKIHMILCVVIIWFKNTVVAQTPADDVYMYIGTINQKTRGTTPVIKVPE